MKRFNFKKGTPLKQVSEKINIGLFMAGTNSPEMRIKNDMIIIVNRKEKKIFITYNKMNANSVWQYDITNDNNVANPIKIASDVLNLNDRLKFIEVKTSKLGKLLI